MKKQRREKDFHRVAIISDLHSVFVDQKAFALFLQIYSDNDFDELVINGDLIDFPTISTHAKRIEQYYPDIIRGYSLDDELDFTEECLLQPLYKASKKRRMIIRMGNHEWRWMRPVASNINAIAQILDVSRRRGTTRLEEMLHLNNYNALITYRDIDILKKRFVLTHGNKGAKNRCERYLQEFMMSGTSGHTHQGLRADKTLYQQEHIVWVESFTLRRFWDGVEYMGQGYIPNWSHGFVDVWFEKNSPRMHIRQHRFSRNYTCIYRGRVYSV